MTGSDGIRPTMASWGDFLLAEFQTTRLRDPTLDMLGVFTDNGAFYDAGYWPSFQHNNPSAGALRCCQALRSTFDRGCLLRLPCRR